ncbi:hypothetical protein RHSIM_Rhsim01G0084100 [Rhododendron simsii]|uniref:Ankyrin repeat family protein n=1 Tax=Rhododendron simsii TaxID=118357 RepID=A0A834HMF2_RHOSS|nr:hypothetical protein RHSIM_Rhsim01G0084100 [Rhododendron simsii]
MLKATFRSDWDVARRFFVKDEIVITAPITNVSETVVHIAVRTGEKAIHLLEKLVVLMPMEAMTLREKHGDTALHMAGTFCRARGLDRRSFHRGCYFRDNSRVQYRQALRWNPRDPTLGTCSKINLLLDSGESGGGKVCERRQRGGRRVETARSVGVEGMGDLLV